MKKILLIVVLYMFSFSNNVFSQNRKLSIPMTVTAEDTIHTNLEKAIALQMDIHNKISENMDKKITRKELDEKAIPMQRKLDSLLLTLDDEDTKVFKYYQTQMFEILVNKQVEIDKKKKALKPITKKKK